MQVGRPHHRPGLGRLIVSCLETLTCRTGEGGNGGQGGRGKGGEGRGEMEDKGGGKGRVRRERGGGGCTCIDHDTIWAYSHSETSRLCCIHCEAEQARTVLRAVAH